MTERTSNLLKAVFAGFIGGGCLYLKFAGITDPNTYFPIVGGALGIFLAVAYLKKAFDS